MTTWTQLTPPKFGTKAGKWDVNDDISLGYVIGSRLVDTVNNKTYVCRNNANGAAIWYEEAERSTQTSLALALAADRVTNSAVETLFANTHSIFANTVKAGDIIDFQAMVVFNAVTQATHDLKVLLGGIGATELGASGAIARLTADWTIFRGRATITSVGAGGTCDVEIWMEGVANGAPFAAVQSVSLDVAIDTTAAMDFGLSCTPAGADVADQVDLRTLHCTVDPG